MTHWYRCNQRVNFGTYECDEGLYVVAAFTPYIEALADNLVITRVHFNDGNIVQSDYKPTRSEIDTGLSMANCNRG